MWCSIFTLLFSLGALSFGRAAVVDEECPGQWNKFGQCLRQQKQVELEKAGLVKPTNEELSQLRSEIRGCFSRFKCGDPVPTEHQEHARLDCFRKSQSKMRTELQECVKKDIHNFSSPENNLGRDSWSIFLKSVNDGVNKNRRWCPQTTSQTDLKNCVEKVLGNFAKRKSGGDSNQKPRNFCEMKLQCKSGSNGAGALTDKCEEQWHRVASPDMCKCSDEMKARGRVRAYQADFLTCMRNRGAKENGDDDPALGWLENGLNEWCRKGGSSGNTCGEDIHSPQSAANPGLGGLFNWFRPTTSTTTQSPEGSGDWSSTRSPDTSTISPQPAGPLGGFFGFRNTPPTQGPDTGGSGFGGSGGFGGLFGGNGNGNGNGLGGGTGGDLFGGFLSNTLGGNPFSGFLGSFQNSFQSFGQMFQGVLNTFGR